METAAAKDRLFRLTNGIVSASATLIAIIALATGIYQARLMRDQAKAAVWPYLIQGNSGNNGYARIVQNVGLGPAVIGAFEVSVDGHIVHSWKEAADSLHIAPSWRGERSTTFRAGLVIPTSTMIELFEIPDTADVRLFRSRIEHLSTFVCFCSLYGDCWTQRADEFKPTPAKSCTDAPERRFLQ